MLRFILLWQICLCCSWKKEISWLETINKIGGVTERKAGEPTEQDEREPDVSVARMGIPRERQQVASWPWGEGYPAEATQCNQSFAFKVLCAFVPLLSQTLLHNPCVNSKYNFSVFAWFWYVKKKDFFKNSYIYLWSVSFLNRQSGRQGTIPAFS